MTTQSLVNLKNTVSLPEEHLESEHKEHRAVVRLIEMYTGSLVGASVAFPIFASAATVCIYIAPRFAFLGLPLTLEQSSWYAPVYGFLITCFVLLIFAAFRCPFALARRANTHAYGMLARYYADLKGRLGEPGVSSREDLPDRVTLAFDDILESTYKQAGLRKAHEAFYDLHQRLLIENTGVEWIFGTAYIHAWRMIHRVQEALIPIVTREELMGTAVHDVRAIQNSQMPDRDILTEKLLRVVKEIVPDGLVYFEDLKSDKKFADIFDEKKPCHQTTRNPQPEMAIATMQEIKHALNTYQDSLWSALVRARNYLSASIALTGFMTFLLLCFVILLEAHAGSNRDGIIAATIYYVVGAVAGLFGRFYKEANTETAPDDYGLFISRLVATPLLSGLAAIGGVLLTATLLSGGVSPQLSAIFDGSVSNMHSTEYLIAAAVFGFAPNLILTSFQQRTQKYAADLQNSKGESSRES